jgi:hypothetical protein
MPFQKNWQSRRKFPSLGSGSHNRLPGINGITAVFVSQASLPLTSEEGPLCAVTIGSDVEIPFA